MHKSKPETSVPSTFCQKGFFSLYPGVSSPALLASSPPQSNRFPTIVYELPVHIEDYPLPSTRPGLLNKDGYFFGELQRRPQPHTNQPVHSPNWPLPERALTLGPLRSSKSPAILFKRDFVSKISPQGTGILAQANWHNKIRQDPRVYYVVLGLSCPSPWILFKLTSLRFQSKKNSRQT